MVSPSLKAPMALLKLPGPVAASLVTVMVAAWTAPNAAVRAKARVQARMLFSSAFVFKFGRTESVSTKRPSQVARQHEIIR